jgi:hypothetical protein
LPQAPTICSVRVEKLEKYWGLFFGGPIAATFWAWIKGATPVVGCVAQCLPHDNLWPVVIWLILALSTLVLGLWLRGNRERTKLREINLAHDRTREATVAILDALGAKVVDGRLEPNDVHQFAGEARAKAAVLLQDLSQNSALIARLDAEPLAGGILKPPAD